MRSPKGFTLLDWVIVMAIIGILVAIAMPAYEGYLSARADRACMNEASAYVKQALADMHAEHAVGAPVLHACRHIDSAQTMSLEHLGMITAAAQQPGSRLIQCDLAHAGTCQ